MKKAKYVIENREYGENSTAEEINALQEQVFLYDPNIVYYKEIKIVTPFSVRTLFDKSDELISRIDGEAGIIMDLRRAQVPSAKTRRAINQRFTKITESVRHCSFYLGGNILIRGAARFVMHQTSLQSFSIHKELDDAIKAINDRLKRS